MLKEYESLVMYFMDWIAINIDDLIRLLNSASPILALLCFTYVVHVMARRDPKIKRTDSK